MKSPLRCLLVLCFLAAQTAVLGAWTTVGDGIEYQQFTTADPNNIFVARMLRSNTNATIESCWADRNLSTGALETVRTQANRLNDAISWWGQSWGQRNRVVVAVNGDFLTSHTDTRMLGGQCFSGWYMKRFNNFGGDSGFAWTTNRVPFMGKCISHTPSKQTVTYTANGSSQKFHGINVPRGSDELIIYTPQFDATTDTDDSGVEVVVQLTRPFVIIPPGSSKLIGYVREIRVNQGATPIPFDCIVLSATGSPASTLLQSASLEEEIWINQEITAYDNNCSTPYGVDWTKTYASVGGNFIFLDNGVIQGTADPGLTTRAPRTAIAYNDTYVFFIVVDGRNPGVSVGMSMSELGTFCKNTLAAVWGMNQDGGGSSTMVVNGVVRNRPSDGSERAVANGIMLVNLSPKVQSTVFSTGQLVQTTTSTNIRLGPGTNYAVMTTAPAGTQGTIAAHALNGIQAKGYKWWKIDFSGYSGWAAETLLTAAGSAPTITAHPSPLTVCEGNSAVFTVSASGTGTLSYQWQKNDSNLSSGGHYSGVTTPSLTITGADSSDAAAYRCVVSNGFGSATSNAANLTVGSPVTLTIGPPSATMTSTGPVSFTVTYENADSVSLDASDVTLNSTGSASGAVSVFGSGAVSRTVMVSGISGDGTLGISIASGTASNGVCAPASAAGPSATVRVAPQVDRIGQVWAFPNSAGLILRNKIVTAAFSGAFWLEEQDRSAAIKVLNPSAVARGDSVDVAGVLGLDGGRRALMADVVDDLGGTGPEPAPLGMIGRSVGGGWFNASTPGVTGSSSLYNMGLLVRCWGSVSGRDTSDPSDKFFFLDDGSGGNVLKVRCGSFEPPIGGWAVVTGVVSSEASGGDTVPMILVRDAGDIASL